MIKEGNLRTSLIVGLVTLFLMVLAMAPNTQGKEITVVAFQWNEYWDEAVELFTSRTGIEVNLQVETGWSTLTEKVPVMVAGGVDVDVVYHDNAVQSNFVNKGLMAPLDDLVTRDGLDLDTWPEAVINGYRFDGKLYSLPTGLSINAMYYNADKLSSAGISELPTDWNTSDFTFDDMTAMAKKLTRDSNGDGTPDEYGLQSFFSNGVQALPLWGLSWFSDDLSTYLGDQSEQIDALTEVASLWREHNVVGGNFPGGTAAMTPVSAWYLNYLDQQDGLFNWKIGVLPRAVCRCAPTGFHSWGVVKSSKNIDAAWQFVKFMTTDPQGAQLFSLAENRIPVLRESIEAFEASWNQKAPEANIEVLTHGFEWVRKENWAEVAAVNEVWELLNGTMSKVVQGEADLNSALTGIKPSAQALLKQ